MFASLKFLANWLSLPVSEFYTISLVKLRRKPLRTFASLGALYPFSRLLHDSVRMDSAATSSPCKWPVILLLLIAVMNRIVGIKSTLSVGGKDVESQSDIVAAQDKPSPDGGFEGWLTVLGV